MNDVVSEVSESEGEPDIWWLFLDADEFPHGPGGMTLRRVSADAGCAVSRRGHAVLRPLPERSSDDVASSRHPLDFQPLCEELAYPMCPSWHRKHPLQRYDKGGAPIECGTGFHLAHCAEQLYEPSQPAFLHHFPFRDEDVTRRRLEALWAKDQGGVARALESRDTHMLARFRSLDAGVSPGLGFGSQLHRPRPHVPARCPRRLRLTGVSLRPWSELVEAGHQHVLRWYSMRGAWKYDSIEKFPYGDDTTYRKGIAFLDGHGTIEDWGCGFAHARTFVTKSQYVGLDGSSTARRQNCGP